MMVSRRHHESHQDLLSQVDLVSLAVVLVALVAIVLCLIGVAVRETSPLVIVPPLILAFWGIVTLRKR